MTAKLLKLDEFLEEYRFQKKKKVHAASSVRAICHMSAKVTFDYILRVGEILERSKQILQFWFYTIHNSSHTKASKGNKRR